MLLKLDGENYMINYVHVLFSKKIMFSLKKTTTVVIVEGELDAIGNLEDLPRLVFIDKECGNLKVFVDGGDLTRNINYKKSNVACRCPLRDRFHQ